MGELVLFRPRTNEIRRSAAAGVSAEILFFTGVRIVRMEETEAPPKARRRRAPPRREPPRKRRDRTS